MGEALSKEFCAKQQGCPPLPLHWLTKCTRAARQRALREPVEGEGRATLLFRAELYVSSSPQVLMGAELYASNFAPSAHGRRTLCIKLSPKYSWAHNSMHQALLPVLMGAELYASSFTHPVLMGVALISPLVSFWFVCWPSCGHYGLCSCHHSGFPLAIY